MRFTIRSCERNGSGIVIPGGNAIVRRGASAWVKLVARLESAGRALGSGDVKVGAGSTAPIAVPMGPFITAPPKASIATRTPPSVKPPARIPPAYTHQAIDISLENSWRQNRRDGHAHYAARNRNGNSKDTGDGSYNRE